jgi:hypothetical protein
MRLPNHQDCNQSTQLDGCAVMVPFDQPKPTESLHSGSQVPSRQDEETRAAPHPQITVNLFNGPGTDGPGVRGSGSCACGAATSNVSNAGSGGGALTSSLVDQLAALSKRVDHLSSLVSVRVPVIECGVWDTASIRSWDQVRALTEGRVNFTREFKSIPMVAVSIRSADVCNATNFRVKVYATDIDRKGFTAHADSWRDTSLHGCQVAWMAIEE